MTLENAANIASIVSAVIGLIGLWLVYKFIFKQKNNSTFTINGDVNGDVISGGVKASPQFKEHEQ